MAKAWERALASFDEALRIDPEDGPSRTFKARCETFLTSPPEWLTPDWDGVWDGVYVL